MMTTNNLVDVLDIKLPTSVETINTLKFLRTYEPRNEDSTFFGANLLCTDFLKVLNARFANGQSISIIIIKICGTE